MLNTFIFISWAIFLLGAIYYFRIKMVELKIDLEAKKVALQRAAAVDTATYLQLLLGKQNPDKNVTEMIKSLMKTSPGHEEVQEIEPGEDELIGIVFSADQYPPEFGEDEEDYEET